MDAYQDFLNFFTLHNKERLDGLSEQYFTAMTRDERARAFDYLMARVERGGSEESVFGLFRADSQRAVAPVRRLLQAGTLNAEAQIAAAWNLWQLAPDDNLLVVFIHFLSSSNAGLREKAAYWIPASTFTKLLKLALQRMIRTETDQLARIHAVDKLLECYGVSEESIGKETYMNIYRNLHSDHLARKEDAFIQLEAMYEAS